MFSFPFGVLALALWVLVLGFGIFLDLGQKNYCVSCVRSVVHSSIFNCISSVSSFILLCVINYPVVLVLVFCALVIGEGGN